VTVRIAETIEEFDRIVAPILQPRGIDRLHPGEHWTREDGMNPGRDRVKINASSNHFSVALGYLAPCMKWIPALIPEGEEMGFVQSTPYLGPVRMLRRPKEWSCRNKGELRKSLDLVASALQDVGLPWLDSLRDPQVYADGIISTAVVPSAFANEAAGRMDEARAAFEEARSLLKISQAEMSSSDTDREYFRTRLGRNFILVALKLDVDHEERQALQEELEFYPDVSALPAT